jgi:hypothetical protein
MSLRAEKREQISVFLENRPGVIAELCGALTKQNVNIEAMAVVDSFDIATLRLVVDDPARARQTLETSGVAYVPVNVLSVRIPNVPGALGRMTQKMADENVNIEYMYGSTLPTADSGCAILRVADEEMDRVLRMDLAPGG